MAEQTPWKVTQADREAAADAVLRWLAFQHGGEQVWMVAAVGSIRKGEQDDHEEVQALARHRHEAQAPLVEALRAARGALQGMLDSWLDYHDEHGLTDPISRRSGDAFDKTIDARETIDSLLARVESGQ